MLKFNISTYSWLSEIFGISFESSELHISYNNNDEYLTIFELPA